VNDDLSGQYLQAGDDDPQLAEDNARFRAAAEQEEQSELGAAAEQSGFNITHVFEGVQNRPLRWLYRLPTNMAAGAWRALGNTIDTASDVMGEALQTPAKAGGKAAAAVADAVGASGTAKKTRERAEAIEIPSLSQAYPDLMQSFYSIADDLEKHNRPEDDITVGMTQFALPFMGWLKAMGGLQGASKVATVAKAATAEAATAGSAFDPQDGRFADMIQMGRGLDNRFGDLLQRLSPDGSLSARYIDYMTNRAGEGPWEGRFKNAVDSLATTAAVAGFVKVAGKTFRKTRRQLDKKAEKLETAEVPGA